MNTPIENVIGCLGRHGCDPRPTGSGKWSSRCPAHDGGSHNLSVKECEDGTVLLRCHHKDESGATCTAEDVVAEIGLKMSDLFPDGLRNGHGKPTARSSSNGNGHGNGRAKPEPPERAGTVWESAETAFRWIAGKEGGEFVASWTYLSADGKAELMKVGRINLDGGVDGEKPKKKFRPAHRVEGGWRIGDPPGLLPLYRLDGIATGPNSVFVAEGEKCADLVAGLGFTATTSSHGSDGADKTDWSPLAGKTVYLLPDVGPAGVGYANRVGAILSGLDPKPVVKVVDLGLKADGDDVEQWIASRPEGESTRNRLKAIEQLCEAARPWEPPPEAPGRKKAPRPPASGAGHAGRPRKGASHAPGEPIDGANFDARIVEELIRHECGAARRQYRIRATRGDVVAEAVVDAKDYESMDWVAEQLGANWLIKSGREAKGFVRETIQESSIEAGIPQRECYTSLGWIERDGRPYYLHAGGAIGADGAVDLVEVDLQPALSRYRLPDPPSDPDSLRGCVAACFGLLDLAKPGRAGSRGAAAVLATIPWRSVLGPIDATVHLSGGTGTRKTSAARLAYQHHAVGVEVDDRLSAAWNSTPGSLQRYAYDCNCSLLVIDELTGERAVATATEFIQNQGNLKGRDRMDRQFRLAPSLDPRCGVLSTGEADPTRQSALGRMLTARFTRETIDLPTLSACQADAAAGKYAGAMAAYLRWLAEGDRLATVRAEQRALAAEITKAVRDATEGKDVHPRHPAIVAELASAYRFFLRFAVECGAIGEVGAAAYMSTVEDYLVELATDQADTQAESNPARQFLSMLASGLTSGRYHVKVAGSDNAPTHYPTACGWHKDWVYQGGNIGPGLDWKVPANSRAIGFIDEAAEVLYVDPEQAKALARTMGRDQGEHFENVAKIGRALSEAGMILTTVEGGKVRFTPQKRLPGVGKQRYFIIPVRHVFGDED